MKILAVVSLALLAGASPPKPRVELKPLQRVTNLLMGTCEAVVTFKLRVDDAGAEDYYCPRVVWEWEDGGQSSEESDCVPFDKAAKEDRVRTWSRSRSFHMTGTLPVRVTLCQANKKVRIVDTTATIEGWDGCPAYQGRHTARTGPPLDYPVNSDSDAIVGHAPEGSRDPCAERKN